MLDRVSFSYDGTEEILRDISLTIKQGTVNALVGSSGSGRSTIANLIMGFWKPLSGTITISGQNINEVGHSALTQLVSIVQ